jgi:hypothetical protein
VTFQELVEIAKLCNFNIEDLNQFRTLLSQCGVIIDISHQRSDNAQEYEGFAHSQLYSPQWLAQLFVTLYPNELASYQVPREGILTKEAIEQCWRAPKFPLTIHETLFQILHELDYLAILNESHKKCKFSLGRRNSSFEEMKAIAFIPANLSVAKSESLVTQILEPAQFHCNSIFFIDYLPQTYFPKVMVS